MMKIKWIFLIILLTACQKGMDLEKIDLVENLYDYDNLLIYKNVKTINLAQDYKFFKMDDSGSIEKNKGRTIKDYYVEPNNSQVTYSGIPYDELMFRTIDDTIAYYRFDIHEAKETQRLFTLLKEKYGKGKLVYGRDMNKSQIYIWNVDNKIFTFSTILYSKMKDNEKREYWLGGALVMVDENELRSGTCPFYTSMLNQIDMPDLRE